MRTRRTFILSGTAALATYSVHPALSQITGAQNAFTNATLGAYQQGILSQAQFEARIGSLFMVMADETITLYTRLRSVTPWVPKSTKAVPGTVIRPRSSRPQSTRQVSTFTLIFDSDKTLPQQGSYIADHATLGRFVLFLVPGISATGSPSCTGIFTSFTEV